MNRAVDGDIAHYINHDPFQELTLESWYTQCLDSASCYQCEQLSNCVTNK